MGSLQEGLVFEVSWEVANKVGGIHTVLTGKAPFAYQRFGNRYICVGPYIAQGRQNWEPRNQYAEWQAYLERKHRLQVHPGLWKISGVQVPTWLIDFHPLLGRKDEIFYELWQHFGVNSLWSGWDYIEPAIFGYAAGMVIASFLEFYYGEEVEVVAHFHEWLVGGGVLYLRRHKPSVATVFTTHATVVGRAAEGHPIAHDPERWASERGLTAKYTLERAAWQEADVATTVSDLVGQETSSYLGSSPDVITPNGWNAPNPLNSTSGKAFLETLLTKWGLSEQGSIVWLMHSGRPELVNKGTYDLLEAIRRYQEAPLPQAKLGLLIAMPAEVTAPKPHTFHRLWVSHELAKPQDNPLYQRLRELALAPGEQVFIAYLPVYLEGSDGVVNVSYYDLLAAVDVTVFASRYEPWGYTPQESIGVGVPTVSSVQAGYGQWMKGHVKPLPEALWLIDHSVGDALGQILNWLYRALRWDANTRLRMRREALQLATHTTWERFFPLYMEAYEIALRKRRLRQWDYKPMAISVSPEEGRWARAFFKPNLPEALSDLSRLAYNLWWSWNPTAQELFAMIDPTAWENHENPVWLLNHTPQSRWHALLQDKSFRVLLNQVVQNFDTYLATPLQNDKPTVLYLCLEYGFMRSFPIYSGGLGVLAADYLKELSDEAYPAWAVGLLYRYGYFEQEVTAEGQQVERRVAMRFSDLPLRPLKTSDGRWVRLEVPLGRGVVYLKVWQVEVGRSRLYLLDADLEANSEEMRAITYQLYPADSERRLMQEIVLGIGAELLARQGGLSYDLVHYNEGHPVFHFLAQVETEIERGFSLREAIELCRARTLFTTHTPVPAGHDAFPVDLVQTHIGDYVERVLKWDWEDFTKRGCMPPKRGFFNLTAFGVWAAARVNAVSQLHARVTQGLLKPLYPGYLAAEVPVVGITNGVHIPTWRASIWERARRLWETHLHLKRKLWQYLQDRLREASWSERYLEAVQRFLKEDFMEALVLGFARRIAAYKRHRILLESQRMAQLFEKYPLRLILAGKAHPADSAGKEALQALWNKSLEPPFFGKVLFIPGYDLTLARYLVQGVDVWVNMPVYGQEASGTSGMKALLNGVLHLSVPDGWWAEVEPEAAGGWRVPLSPDQNPERRDPYEALSLAAILEQEVWPAFAQRDAEGLPQLWIARMEKAQTYGLKHFGTHRMAHDYIHQLYLPVTSRYLNLISSNYEGLRTRVERHARLQQELRHLKVRRLRLPPFQEVAQIAREPFLIEVEIEPTSLPPEERRLEIVFEKPDGTFYRFPLESISETVYQAEVVLEDPGVYHWALRFYGYDPLLAERWYEGSLLVEI